MEKGQENEKPERISAGLKKGDSSFWGQSRAFEERGKGEGEAKYGTSTTGKASFRSATASECLAEGEGRKTSRDGKKGKKIIK